MLSGSDHQLPLNLNLREGPSFVSFVDGPNSEIRQQVEGISSGKGDSFLYLWGMTGTGKTHLLQAACRQQKNKRSRVAFAPLSEAEFWKPEILLGLEEMSLICIDDLDRIAGQPDWEEALFHLFNRTRGNGKRLIWSGAHAPGGLGIGMPDLVSRIASSLVLHLRPLTDSGRKEVLRRRAAEQGFELPIEVAEYLLRRQPRDTHSLVRLLERLDRASLAAQRRVTIPFIRSLLEKERES